MRTLSERIKSAMSDKGMKQIELAAAVGLTRGAVSLWMNGTTKELTSENLVNAARALGVSPIWLATGRGEKTPSTPAEVNLDKNCNYPAIQRVKFRISAGMTGFGIEPIAEGCAPIVFSRKWYERNGYDPAKLFAIKVSGDSMVPGIYDGDWVVINTADTTPKDGAVFALNYEGDIVVKRLFKSEGRWLAVSDNPDKRIHRDRPVTQETFVLGRIVHKQSETI